MLVKKANAVQEDKTTRAMCLYHQCNQSIQVTDVVMVTSIFANLLLKASVALDHLCQIVLNQKLSVNSKNGVNFQVMLKQNWTKRNHMK